MDIRGHAALVTGGGPARGRNRADAGRPAPRSRSSTSTPKPPPKWRSISAASPCNATWPTPLRPKRRSPRPRPTQARRASLVNCAGIGTGQAHRRPRRSYATRDFERVIRVNLIGTFNTMRLAANAMQSLAPLNDGERGVIICTASVAAFEGQIGQAAYASSKGGVVGAGHAGGARIRPVRHPRQRHRAGHVLDADAERCRSKRSRASPPRCRFRNCSASRRNMPRWCAT